MRLVIELSRTDVEAILATVLEANRFQAVAAEWLDDGSVRVSCESSGLSVSRLPADSMSELQRILYPNVPAKLG